MEPVGVEPTIVHVAAFPIAYSPICNWWEGWESNPLTQRERIYSPPRLSDFAAYPYDLLIRRVYSKSYHWERALTQVIILQLPRISPEGVTLYIYTLFGCPSGARTQDTAVNSRMLVPTELRGNIKGFLFSYLIYYNIFFLKNQERFFA